jgi:hypothetical protein
LDSDSGGGGRREQWHGDGRSRSDDKKR